MQLRPNTLLQGGKYRIIRTLGQGGFGITYEAKQVNLDRVVAVKEFFMKDCCERDSNSTYISVPTQSNREIVAKFKGKFVREAKMIASFDHPNIVRIIDIFDENGTAYYVMENLPGGSLADKVNKDGPLTEAKAEEYIRQVADALSYIHSRNTVHLDVKPSNILLNAKGEAVLIDFGISKHYDDSGEQTSSTPVGISKGYAPLEQGRDGDVSQFKPSTDIYALGATLFYLLSGIVPPEASIVYEEGLIRHEGVSDKTWATIEKAMRPKRKDRPQAISDFMKLLCISECNSKDDNRMIDNQIEATKLINLSENVNDSLSEIYPNELTVINLENDNDVLKTRSNKTKKNYRYLEWIPSVIAALLGLGVVGFLLYNNMHLRIPEEETYSQTPIESTTFSSRHPILEGIQYGQSNGEYWVDLGLSVKWAAYDLGVSSEILHGFYYSWGESSIKASYSWLSYKYWNSGNKDNTILLKKYNLESKRGAVDGKTTLDDSDDAARTLWKGGWRIPTVDEIEELITKCTWTATTIKNVRGYKVQGPSGGSIFFPLSGFQRDKTVESWLKAGYYWSSNLFSSSSECAWCLCIGDSGNVALKSVHLRCDGLNIRAVIE